MQGQAGRGTPPDIEDGAPDLIRIGRQAQWVGPGRSVVFISDNER